MEDYHLTPVELSIYGRRKKKRAGLGVGAGAVL
jgi:hypothetical protein